MGWYAVFSREVLILYKKIGQMGYVFSSIISPFIYLFAFGYGLGSRVEVAGGYLPFLAGGIIGITVMINAFQQTATSVSVGKMYYHIFQNLVLSPIRDFEVIFGIIGAGMLRGIFFGGLIFIMAWLVFGAVSLHLSLLAGAVFGSFCFAALGVIVGLLVRQPDDAAFVNNFIIMPMTFFGGSFFPVDSLPEALRVLVMIFPIGALNRLMRSPVWDDSMLTASLVLVLLGLLFFWVSVLLYRRYSE